MQSPNSTTPGSESLRIAFFTDFYAPQVNGVAVSLWLLADPARRREFGQVALELSRKYSVEAQVEALIETYHEAISARLHTMGSRAVRWGRPLDDDDARQGEAAERENHVE